MQSVASSCTLTRVNPKPMPAIELLKNTTGTWKGQSTLNMAWLPEGERLKTSDSTMTITANEEHVTIQYTWVESDKPQEGTMIVASNDENKAQIAWVDSWHMAFPILVSEGTADPLSVTGAWAAGDETWFWRTEFSMDGETLKMEMTNITPAGEEEWAVRAEYHRA